MTTPASVLSGEAAWTVISGDCREVMREIPDGSVDAIVTDPPYGMGWDTNSKRFSGGAREHQRGPGRDDHGDIKGDAEPFDPTPWLTFSRVVLWGANHYAQRLPLGTTLVWLKRHDHLFGTFLSDAEIGWMKGGHGVYVHRAPFPPPSRICELGGTTTTTRAAHPTQKPLSLMRWCIERAKAPAGGVIVDPYCGSGTTGVAALQLGYRFIGVEIDPVYAETARERIAATSEGSTLTARRAGQGALPLVEGA